MSKKKYSQNKDTGSTLKESAVAYGSAVPEGIYPLQTPEDQGWIDFRDQCRRQMERPMELRIKYGFVRSIKAPNKKAGGRSFKTMAEYRVWCEKNLPDYLGFKRPAR